MMKRLSLLLLSLCASLTCAQSVPNGGSIAHGQIWTDAQWTAAWMSKKDYGSFLLQLGPTSVIVSTTLAVTGASGNGTTATLTFASASAPPIGATIVVSAVNPSGYNGTFTVTAAGINSVSFASSAVASYVGSGSIVYAVMSAGLNTSNISCPTTGSTPVTLPVAVTDGVLYKISNPSSGICTLYTQGGQVMVGMGASATSGVIPAYTNVDVWTITNSSVLQYSVK